MRVLLDTHILLWWAKESERLSDAHRTIIEDAENVCFFSAVSFAEISIKVAIGKLDVERKLLEQLSASGLERLDFTVAHAEALFDLPLLHRDPFDRMLVAQAKVEGIPLLTVDPRVKAYDVATI